MAGWHHWLNGRESEWTPGVGDGQGGLACCDSWGRKESDMTERLSWCDLIWDSPSRSWAQKHLQALYEDKGPGDQQNSLSPAESPCFSPIGIEINSILFSRCILVTSTSHPLLGLSCWLRWYRTCLQFRGSRLDPWVWEIPWRRGWLPSSVFMPGTSHGQRSLVDCSPWAHKASDMTEQLTLTFPQPLLSLQWFLWLFQVLCMWSRLQSCLSWWGWWCSLTYFLFLLFCLFISPSQWWLPLSLWLFLN